MKKIVKFKESTLFRKEKKLAYKCYCTSEELEKEREEQINSGIKSPQYSQKCLKNPNQHCHILHHAVKLFLENYS